MRKKQDKKVRLKSQNFSWKEFLWTFIILSILTAGQAMIYDAYIPIENVPSQYIFGIAGILDHRCLHFLPCHRTAEVQNL